MERLCKNTNNFISPFIKNYQPLEGKLYKAPYLKSSSNVSDPVLIKALSRDMQTIGAQKLNDTELSLFS